VRRLRLTGLDGFFQGVDDDALKLDGFGSISSDARNLVIAAAISAAGIISLPANL
jgi:hypothetical protein